SRRRHTRFSRDWSSDVCSSDLVSPGDLLVTAYQRMKLHDISQLPVLQDEELVGLIDESDLLLHVYGDESKFRDPVSTAMASKLRSEERRVGKWCGCGWEAAVGR